MAQTLKVYDVKCVTAKYTQKRSSEHVKHVASKGAKSVWWYRSCIGTVRLWYEFGRFVRQGHHMVVHTVMMDWVYGYGYEFRCPY